MPSSRCWLFQPFPALDVTGMMVENMGHHPQMDWFQRRSPDASARPKGGEAQGRAETQGANGTEAVGIGFVVLPIT